MPSTINSTLYDGNVREREGFSEVVGVGLFIWRSALVLRRAIIFRQRTLLTHPPLMTFGKPFLLVHGFDQ